MKVSFISLGCAKNLVNTEQMMALCRDAGHTLLEEPAGADAVVINTCGFIDSAKEEAIDTILSVAELKSAGQVGKILVTGCLTQRYQQEILDELPEVDGIMGTGSYGEIVPALAEMMAGGTPRRFADIHGMIDEFDRVLTTPGHYAYLRIAEGCDNRCTYCIIPTLRGRFRSRPIEDIIAEAKDLESLGTKELILVAQDTSRYGEDLYGEYSLARLLRELTEQTSIPWIRLLYLYPDKITDELIAEIRDNDRICKYVDIPIQHISEDVLRRMNRHGGSAVVRDAVSRLRREIPGIVIRTTAIVGFPGETEAEFEELCTYVKEARFDRFGAFPYSREEDTPAYSFPDQIDEQTKQDRYDIIMNTQLGITDELNRKKLGKRLTVLCEGFDPVSETHYGRSYADAPEIDGKIFFTAEHRINDGEFVTVKITDVLDYDLYGKVVSE